MQASERKTLALLSVCVFLVNSLTVSNSIPPPLYITTLTMTLSSTPNRQDHLFSEVICLDWIKWAGIPEHFYFLLLHEQREERHRLLIECYITVNNV